jgi:outer membrane immunogenic protein
MKRLIVASVGILALGVPAASAADIRRPVYQAPPLPIPIFRWTGCYIGGHAGGGWGHKTWSDPFLGGLEFSSHDVSGWLAGGQTGCDYQIGAALFGVEGQYSWANLKGESVDTLSAGTLSDHTRVEALGSITARLGYAWDRTLLYLKGGAAFARDKYHSTDLTIGGATFAETKETHWGWTIGTGIEYAFATNWSAKAEYNYMDFGTRGVGFVDTITGIPFTVDINQHLHAAKLGINYRFGSSLYAGP